MLSSDKISIIEDSDSKPWTKPAQQKARIEHELSQRSDELNYTILRLPLVYGTDDYNGHVNFIQNRKEKNIKIFFFPRAATRLIIAVLYEHLNPTMILLWNDSMKINTVHVDDVVAAAFSLARNPEAYKECYNLVDVSKSTQGTISDVLAQIFGIKNSYWGVTLSNF